MPVCEYCSATVTRKNNLERHQKSEKCQKIQKQKQEERKQIETINEFIIWKEEIIKLLTEAHVKKFNIFSDNYVNFIMGKLENKTIEDPMINIKPEEKKFSVIDLIKYTPDLSINNINKIFNQKFTPYLLMEEYGLPNLFINNIIRDSNGNYGAINTNLTSMGFKFKANNGKIINDIKGKELTKNFKECLDDIIEKKLKEVKDIIKNDLYYSVIEKNVSNFKKMIKYISEQLYVDKNGDGIPTRIKENEQYPIDIKSITDKANNINFKNSSFSWDDDLEEKYNETEDHLMCANINSKQEEVFISSYQKERERYIITEIEKIKNNYRQKQENLKYNWLIKKGNNIIGDISIKPNKIDHIMRTQVWNEYIGIDIGSIICPYCCANKISQLNFECGHVISEANNGKIELDNFRPICNKCNKSMGKKTMNVNKWNEGFTSQFPINFVVIE